MSEQMRITTAADPIGFIDLITPAFGTGPFAEPAASRRCCTDEPDDVVTPSLMDEIRAFLHARFDRHAVAPLEVIDGYRTEADRWAGESEVEREIANLRRRAA